MLEKSLSLDWLHWLFQCKWNNKGAHKILGAPSNTVPRWPDWDRWYSAASSSGEISHTETVWATFTQVTLRRKDQIGAGNTETRSCSARLALRKVGASQCYLCKVCLKFELQTVSMLSLTPKERAAQCNLSRSDQCGAVLPGVPLFLNFELTRA